MVDNLACRWVVAALIFLGPSVAFAALCALLVLPFAVAFLGGMVVGCVSMGFAALWVMG